MNGPGRPRIIGIKPLHWRSRILTRTVANMLAISLIPLLLVGGAIVYIAGRDAEQKAHDKLFAAVTETANHIEDYLDRMSKDMMFIAAATDRRDMGSEANLRLLSAFASSHADIYAIWALDESGRSITLFSRGDMLMDELPDARAYPRTGYIPGQNLFWHGTVPDAFGERFAVASIDIRQPWEDASHGVMYFKIRINGVQKALDIFGQENIGRAFVVDESGHLIAHTDRGRVLAGFDVLPVRDELKTMLDKVPGSLKPKAHEHFVHDAEGFISTYRILPSLGWIAAVEESTADVYRLRDGIILLASGFFMLVIIAVIPAGLLFSYRLTNPVNHLMRTAIDLAEGRQDKRAEVLSGDEIGVFAETFNRMLDLQQETAMRLAEEKQRLHVTLRSIGDAVIATDTGGNITLMNKVAEELTGWGGDEAAGRPIQDVFNIISEESGERCLNPVEKVLESGLIIGLANHTALVRRDGSRISIADSGAPIRDTKNNIIGVVLVFRDITGQKLIEDRMVKSLREKDILLKEVHHRVKNNMAVISSLLMLQSGYIKDSKYKEMFRESQSRISSMALVHEKLYQSRDFTHIDGKDYLESLIGSIKGTFCADEDLRVKLDVEAISLDIDILVPCGLIVNELFTNALKHACCKQKMLEISVSMARDADGNVVLRISDNGMGFPEGFDPEKAEGLGLKLVYVLVSQINGRLEVQSGNGVAFTITFPAQIEHARHLPKNG